MKHNTPKPTALTGRQQQALPYLVVAGSLTEAAQLAEISRTTLYRWMEDEEFRKQFDRLREKASEFAFSELKGLMLKGTQVLAEGMEHDNPAIRLRSARIAMEIGLKANVIKTIEKRVDLLDQAMRIKED